MLMEWWGETIVHGAKNISSFENAQCGPTSQPGAPGAPMCPLAMTVLPQPLFSPLTWEAGPAQFTDGVTGAQRGGGRMGPEPSAQGPMWVL